MTIYVRASVNILGTKGRIDGRIEVGLSYQDGEKPSQFRAKLVEVVGASAAWSYDLDEDGADRLAREVDGRISALWARKHFVEIWRGTGADAEPLVHIGAAW